MDVFWEGSLCSGPFYRKLIAILYILFLSGYLNLYWVIKQALVITEILYSFQNIIISYLEKVKVNKENIPSVCSLSILFAFTCDVLVSMSLFAITS